MGKKQLRALANGLVGATLSDGAEDRFGYDPHGLARLNELFEAARGDLAKFAGLTDLVQSAIRESLVLARQGRHLDGTSLLIDDSIAVKEGTADLDKVRHKYTPTAETRAKLAATEARRIKRSLARKPRELRSAFDREDGLRPEIVDPQALPFQQAEQLSAYLRGQGVGPAKAVQQADGAIIEQCFKRLYQPGTREQDTHQMRAELGLLVERAMEASFDPVAAEKLRLAGILERVANVQGMLEDLERSAGVVGEKKKNVDEPGAENKLKH